ncbi:MAG: aspartyl/glutamyl-tRNA amidotransferase subunit C [Deltaproteobacteria bacterium]|jgi:aspartyl-tRNA(Asn)/glutamyl-tRNA(Gln) amidotransferase subunit C|nr:aspartyl/glutamyl-tRNA amidotransferase subunit C [Deltaproteobacteria bacterium]
MAVDAMTAKAIADLARLSLSGGTVGDGPESGGASAGDAAYLERVADEMSKIVGYMDILNECDTAGVEPMYSPMLDPQPPREDVPRETSGGSSDWIVDGAPETFGRFFTVPRVL